MLQISIFFLRKSTLYLPKVWGNFQFNLKYFNFCNVPSQTSKFFQFDQFYPKLSILPLIFIHLFFFIKMKKIKIRGGHSYPFGHLTIFEPLIFYENFGIKLVELQKFESLEGDTSLHLAKGVS